ncbi:MAG: type VI secretion system tip protein VgrG [Myxococcales bacterium]|jgi:type VI secretion system secreted protein VgrG|nr:type VI secretion system tip protein VgrG [Myxococcales bacterium]
MAQAGRMEAELTVGSRRFMVLGYDLQRRLGAVDRLHCRAVIPDTAPLPPEALVAASARFRLRRLSDDATLHFTGEIVRVSVEQSVRGVATTVFEVRPRLWRLAARRSSRVFQDLAVPDIVREVLDKGGVDAARQEWRLVETHPVRKYVVQHQETDLEFCQRLLAEAGIYFCCLHDPDEDEKVLFGDEGTGFGEVTRGATELPFTTSFGADGSRDDIFKLSRRSRIRPGRVTARDYDPERPSLGLEHVSEGCEDDASLEVYAFPARATEPDEVEVRAMRLRESLEVDRHVVDGETGALHLELGHSFEIVGHPWERLNGPCIVTRLEFSGSAGRQFAVGDETEREHHVCRFEAVPGATVLRPEPRPVARVAPGIQLAMTTGPAGEEIHTDEHGRVVAQFLWDRQGKHDEHSGCWMRTSQVPTGGSMLLPRVGWEVAVRYAEGDVDQPVVVERLYNGLTPPPYSLPANAARSSLQTATTPGGGSSNELRMSDVAGEEQMFLNASYDMSVNVGNNATLSIGNDQSVQVGANQTMAVLDSVSSTVGADQSIDVGANQTISVSALMVDDVGGNHTLSIGGNRMHSIGGDHRRTVTGDSSCSVGGNDINLVVGDVSDSTASAYTHDVGAAYIQMTAADRSLLVGGARTETTGAAKVILAKGNRGVEAGLLSAQTGGALLVKVDGDSAESATIAYSETVGGVTTVKAKNVVIEASVSLSITMGGASVTLSPASVAISGASVKFDGNTVDVGMVLDN